MSRLQLLLLGHFDCLLPSGQRISLSMRKAEVLLAYLALAPGIRHPRERLINLLWSDRGEEQARNSLRQCLSTIRKTLGDAADLLLQVDRSTVMLKAEMADVDALEFERLAADADFESLTDAAELYRGEFLEGIVIRDAAGQDWIDGERSRFKRHYVEILTNLGHTLLASRDYSRAIQTVERLVEQDPLSEAGWRLLMRACHENGDRSHALQAFKRCQKVLRDELGVDPETETVQLRDRIASGERSADTARAMQPPKAVPTRKDPTDHPARAPAETKDRSIAVLPFDNLSGDPEQEYFSDGITDSIIMNLALFPDLKVKSRNSSFAFKQQIKSLGDISRELEVHYLVEGSVRRAAGRIRVNVQLIEAASGDQVWGRRYDSELEDLFELEEDLSRSIAATVTGQIDSELQRIALSRNTDNLRSYDLMLQGIYYANRNDASDLALAIEKLNESIALEPNNARAHANLAFCYQMGWIDRWLADPDEARNLCGEHALRAIELDPKLGMAHVACGEFLLFSHQLDKAGKHFQKALDINPNDSEAVGTLAIYLSCTGRFEEALEKAEHALRLDPYHRWARWIMSEALFFCGRYPQVLETIDEIGNPPGFIQVYRIAALIELGREADAREALQQFLRFSQQSMANAPRTPDEWLAYSRVNAPFADPALNQRLVDYLVRAGLDNNASRSRRSADTGTPNIAVLPFDNLSGDPEQEYFSDGITSSLILGLGMFRGLRVKSQNSSFAYRDSAKSSTEIANELGVDFLVEGSIRKSGNRVRLAVQLVEAESDTQIWGKQYDAELENILDLEQQLSSAVAGTISGRIGHTLQKSASHKPASDLRSYDYLLRGLYHFGRFSADELKKAREMLEKCIEIDPENAIAHTNLGAIHEVELMENWSSDRQRSRDLSLQHLSRALELEPDNAVAHAFMAEYLMNIRRDFDQAEFHADKAIELNPTSSEAFAAKADLLGATRRVDEAIACADKCLQLDPHSVGAGWCGGEVYRRAGQYQKAIKTFRSISYPPPSVHALVAACFVQMELLDEARNEMALFRQLANRHKTSLPSEEAQWRDYWRNNLPYQFEADFDAFFKLLVEAGLLDEASEKAEELPSIAVLPFDNMSGDPEQEHFADGITSDLIDTLSRFRHLRTVSRYSTLPYKASKPPISEIAAQQQVRYILEGNVRRSGNRVRVSAELIDAQTEGIIWSQRFDRDLEDLFAVQDELTQDIALAMKVQLDDGEMARLRSKGTKNVRAWELIMTAVDLGDTYIRSNILDARRMAEQAIELDPDYPYAWICLGWTHWQEAYSGSSPSIEASIDEAEKANTRAHDLDPDYAEVWSQRGMLHLMRHRADAAVEDCLKAVELEPGSAEIQGLAAFAHIFAGQYQNAKKYNQNMLRLSPIRANWHYLPEGQIEVATGSLEKAAELYRQGIAVEPESPLCRYFLIDLMLQLGDQASAQRYADEIRELDQSVSARGIAQSYSADPALRQAFHDRLAKFGLV